MRVVPVVLTTAGLSIAAAPAMAADLSVTIEIPRIASASYSRPYVAMWIEGPDQAHVRTVAVWYDTRLPNGEGKDWLRDLRTWWRKAGRATSLPADGVSGPTRAPGRQVMTVSSARLAALPAGQYTLVVEAARQLGGREAVRVPFRWGAPNAGAAAGTTELGAVRVAVTR